MTTADFFRKNLFAWAAENPRPMPWKGEKDPYKIWLSEIILQQTRVEQGWPYFEKFVANYPTVQALAAAPEDDVLKLWEGLGYYTRARNLHAGARYIAHELNGVFPNSFDGLRNIKGVGDYTAAAVASFAYNLPHAVLDGNVYRVLSRFFAIETPTDLPAAKKQFSALAQEMLDPGKPAAFNQAMMDFGATCCTPAQPKCGACTLSSRCLAFQLGRQNDFPVRIKKAARKERFFLYLIVQYNGKTYLQKRSGKDIWRGLHEFPMQEVNSAADLTAATFEQLFLPAGLPPEYHWAKSSPQFRQILTHQEVVAVFLELHLPPEINPAFFGHFLFKESFEVPYADVKKKFAFPRVIIRFFDKNG